MNRAHRSRGLRVLPGSEWPANLTLRRGFSFATARPWNSANRAASLRLRRGGSRFLGSCVGRLHELGAPSVYSSPVPLSQLEMWSRAGFSKDLELALLRLDLDTQPPPPDHPVVEVADVDPLVSVDAAAFDDFWALDHNGLAEALAATSRGTILTVGEPIAGFAIVGFSGAAAYLQRVAVHPDHQGAGLGTALLTESVRRARRMGARSLFLNTQVDNDRSLRLYTRLGFRRLPSGLYLMRA